MPSNQIVQFAMNCRHPLFRVGARPPGDRRAVDRERLVRDDRGAGRAARLLAGRAARPGRTSRTSRSHPLRPRAGAAAAGRGRLAARARTASCERGGAAVPLLGHLPARHLELRLRRLAERHQGRPARRRHRPADQAGRVLDRHEAGLAQPRLRGVHVLRHVLRRARPVLELALVDAEATGPGRDRRPGRACPSTATA